MSELLNEVLTIAQQDVVSRILFYFGLFFFLSGVWESIKGWRSVKRLTRQVKGLNALRLKDSSRVGVEGRAVTGIVDALKAYDDGATPNPDLTQQFTAIERRLLIPVHRAKALAGLLIIVGLLLTLFNLQRAVGEMSDTFAWTSDRPVAMKASDSPSGAAPSSRSVDVGKLPSPEALQEGMRKVIESAGTAFLLSALAIGLAALLLLSALQTTAFAERALADFRDWASDQAIRIAKEVEPRRRQDPTEALILVLQKLGGLTEAFQDTSQALRDLRQFGATLDASAASISAAVKDLPSAVASSVDGLGNQLAVGVAEGLNHQLTYLNQLIVHYGDQAGAMKVLADVVRQSAETARTSAAQLAEVPRELAAIRRTLAEVVAATARSSEATDKLTLKVDELPAAEMREAVVTIEQCARHIASIQVDVAGLMPEITAVVGSTARDTAARITVELDRLRSAIVAIPAPTDVSAPLSNLHADVSALARFVTEALPGHQRSLDRIREGVAVLLELARREHQSDSGLKSPDVSRVQAKLEALSRRIESLPWFRLERLLNRH